MAVPRLIGSSLVVTLVILAACSVERVPGPNAELRHAAATWTCGFADAPAVAIYLSPSAVRSLEPPTPYVRIVIWQPLDRLAGRSWAIEDRDLEGGAAWFHSAGSRFEVATGGTVTVTAVAPDKTVEGSADLTFPHAGRVQARFRAAWLMPTTFCG